MDIGSHDLFMDIHYLALDKGNTGLAEVAKKKANELDDRPTDDEEDDDDDVFSDEEDESSGESSSGEEGEEDDDVVEEEDDDEEGKVNGKRIEEEILPGDWPLIAPLYRFVPQ